MACNNLEVDLIIDNVYTNLVKVCPSILKILSSKKKKKNLTSIKSGNSLANLRKMMFYHPNADLVNDNVYTHLVKFFNIHSFSRC